MFKKTFAFLVLAAAAVVLLSWGVTGHRTVGKIAENHLSAAARAAVRELLGNESLADVSTWADEVRGQSEYRATAGWHFANLPLGLDYAAFQRQVEGATKENVYSALLQQEKVLTDKSSTREKKIEALKFVVHFVGDLHQPMHISREEDKGGNTIQLNFEGQGTNLHSLWDSKLLDKQGLDYEQLAAKYDKASAAEIRQWQSDPMIKWIWESYQISSKLYAEVDAMKSRSIGDSYYQEHILTVDLRIEQAGIRLAGVLNTVFKNGLTASATGPATSAAGQGGSSVGSGGGSGAAMASAEGPAKSIDIHEAAKHVDENVAVCGVVYGYKNLGSMTLVNLGAAYPNQLMTVVLRGEARNAYEGIDGKAICVTGKVEMYKEKPEIVVTNTKQLSVK